MIKTYTEYLNESVSVKDLVKYNNTLEDKTVRLRLASLGLNPSNLRKTTKGYIYKGDFVVTKKIKEMPNLNLYKVEGDFVLKGVGLTSVKHFPYVVDGDVYINKNDLVTIEKLDIEVNGVFVISDNSKLRTIKNTLNLKCKKVIKRNCPNLKMEQGKINLRY